MELLPSPKSKRTNTYDRPTLCFSSDRGLMSSISNEVRQLNDSLYLIVVYYFFLDT
jgi:hypothetical protein